MKKRTENISGRIAAVLLLLPLLAITVLPSVAAPLGGVGSSPSKSSKQVSYNGISFSYDISLASKVIATVVPELRGDSNTAFWTTHPDEVVFEFKDFAYSTSALIPARIYVFPVKSDYRYLNSPPETIDFWGRQVDSLRDLLARRPKLTGPISAQGESLIPFLPPINAGQFLVGKHGYMNFRSGAGIHYLVHFAQEVRTASREDTFYTYQGLTADGKYYVAARFPAFLATPPDLSHLPRSTQKDSDNFYKQLRGIVDQTDDAGFQPNLGSLNSIISSLTIDSSPVKLPSGSSSTLPSMPGTGTSSNLGFPSTRDMGAVVLALALVITIAGLAIQMSSLEKG